MKGVILLWFSCRELFLWLFLVILCALCVSRIALVGGVRSWLTLFRLLHELSGIVVDVGLFLSGR